MSSGLFYTDSMIEAAVPFPRCRDDLVVSRLDFSLVTLPGRASVDKVVESFLFLPFFVLWTGVELFAFRQTQLSPLGALQVWRKSRVLIIQITKLECFSSAFVPRTAARR
jgi:hypothetical protein